MIAALFPGQGSQAVGMGRELMADQAARPLLERAFAVLPGLDGLMFEGPLEALTLTENTQPALVAAGYAAFRAWRVAAGRGPDFAAGHSLGEFTALVAAGALEFDDALRLVRARGHYMQAAVAPGEGAMAAVMRLEPAEIGEALGNADGRAEVANLNSPGQTVISGSAVAVAMASERLRARGARVIPLAVSAPFHSSLMRPARERLERDLALVPWCEPEFPVVANVTARPVPGPADLPRLLGEQVTGTVRWVESVRALWALGAREFVEFGPGNVLTGLVKRIVPEAATYTVAGPADIAAYLEAHRG